MAASSSSNVCVQPNFRRAVAAYQHAIALDPNFAAAYAGLAVSKNELSRDPGNSLAELRARARKGAGGRGQGDRH